MRARGDRPAEPLYRSRSFYRWTEARRLEDWAAGGAQAFRDQLGKACEAIGLEIGTEVDARFERRGWK